MKTYYFDYNATTPLAPQVRQVMEPFLTEHFGNPSSLHTLGKQAARAVREARKKMALLLGTDHESEIIFTSGGTESNNAAIRSALASFPDKKEIVTSSVEHSSVYRVFRQLEKEGYKVHWIKVDQQGQLDFTEFDEALSERTALVSIMTANNETGAVFPTVTIAEKVKTRGILFHVDAVQSVGKIPVELKNTGIDFLSLSAHKFYGPKGVGALYVRQGTPFHPSILGGAQERGRRAGTENVAGIVGLGAACEMVFEEMETESQKLVRLRDLFERRVQEKIPDISINAQEAERLPNTSNIEFKNADGEALFFALDQKGVCASNGSACMSGSREPSRVLKALGLTDEEANTSLRFSFGRLTTEADIEEGAALLSETVQRIREIPLERQHTHA